MKSKSTPKTKFSLFQKLVVFGLFLPLILAMAGITPPADDSFFSPRLVWGSAILNAAFGVFYMTLIVRCPGKESCGRP